MRENFSASLTIIEVINVEACVKLPKSFEEVSSIRKLLRKKFKISLFSHPRDPGRAKFAEHSRTEWKPAEDPGEMLESGECEEKWRLRFMK